MTIYHDSKFKFSCDSGRDADADWHKPFVVSTGTERTAIKHARERGWAIVHIRITRGAPRSAIRTVRRVYCGHCKWVVGL